MGSEMCIRDSWYKCVIELSSSWPADTKADVIEPRREEGDDRRRKGATVDGEAPHAIWVSNGGQLLCASCGARSAAKATKLQREFARKPCRSGSMLVEL